MATPIVEYIRQSLITALSAITTGNGYDNTVTVEARKQHGNDTTRDRLLVVSSASRERIGDEDTPHQHVAWNQPFYIDAYVVQPETSSTAIDAAVNSLAADIEKAVMQDPHRTVSGTRYAVDTFIRDPQRFVTDDGSAEGITIQIDVHYRTLYSDPYSQ